MQGSFAVFDHSQEDDEQLKTIAEEMQGVELENSEFELKFENVSNYIDWQDESDFDQDVVVVEKDVEEMIESNKKQRYKSNVIQELF
mmetsp:Transcript_13327/g.15447  ORF Transcript_13327/g.15447 Transcript_13327/m.15447 type:complete len:87 (+) Transcript_13327:158-418(+)